MIIIQIHIVVSDIIVIINRL